ncbi:alcohol dehydrogenase catalytic domain-containing protein [Nocardioides mangrovi]|uniref:Alcohol dehydrogenase catalytic domain-containing protein n=1 Tax=Nocardioides mangrovi TaxID=2874580 RepID=A0ABS7UJM7_9ACTN|nr:alcohol dehydrogenase catalytic domain-containing protein [Nocardioides mangrovi]MBZ5741221.1 alcohol dehydrogenase catalytic domain-containing protein [Nocardioides mangrovi]
MRALTFEGPGRRVWHDVPDPVVTGPEDAVVRVDAVTICGTDLHILKGDVPEVTPGRVLGHEAVGTVLDVGAAVSGFAAGDRVLISCVAGCGRCRFCRDNLDGQCLQGGGWNLGHLIDGTQAERVRVPFADRALHHLPASVSDEQALLLADILPTAYEIGVRNGRVTPGSTVAIVGAGPIGLAAVLTARLMTPSRIVVVDPAPGRREAAERAGADLAVPDAAAALDAMKTATDGLGFDTAIEAVGVPETFELCTDLVRAGGTVANVGVHGAPAALHLERLWIKDVTITTGLVDTSSTPMLLRLLAEGRLDTEGLVTHRFGLDEIQDAYDVFERPADSGALKVALFNG